MLTREQITRIYRSHSKEIYAYLCRLSGNPDTAEDLLQEVFEKFIIYTVEKDIQEDKYRAFLYRTAHNLCVNQLIKTKRARLDNIDDVEDMLKSEDTHSQKIVLDELNDKIYRILETVEPESRSIFIMHKESGINYDEIAGQLSLSARTVRRRVKDVTEILHRELKKAGFLS